MRSPGCQVKRAARIQQRSLGNTRMLIDQWAPGTSGLKVSLRDNPGRKGVTTGRTRRAGSFVLVEVDFGPNEKQFKRLDLLELVKEPREPFDLLQSAQFGTPHDLLRVLTFEKVKGHLTNLFYSMESSNTTFYPHQFKPVMRFIGSPVGRLLIADEVGLGKTIEATFIWKELQARQGARRLLIVCPAMLREKWRSDLWTRFAIVADVVGPREILEAVERLAARQLPEAFVWIASLEGLRAPAQFAGRAIRGWRTPLARALDQNTATDAYAIFDQVIIDEAHYLRNPATANNRIARLLRDASRTLVLLTATPIQLGSANLYQLLRLVDPDVFCDPVLFQEMLAANGHIVRAQRALWQQPPQVGEALAAVSAAGESDYFRNDAVLSQVKAHLGEPLDAADTRIELLRLLESRSLLSRYMTRSRKREVLGTQVRRASQVLKVAFGVHEKAIYDHVTRRLREQAEGKSGGALFPLITRQRQMASSIVGALESWRDRGLLDELLWEDFGILGTAGHGGRDDAIGSDATSEPAGGGAKTPVAFGFDFDIAALEEEDSKYRALVRFLTSELAKSPAEKFVIFAFFRGTLSYLFRRLRADGIRASLLMGNIGVGKDKVVREFLAAGGPTVLLSSEVGSEGIDLQACRFAINYDLPWNPMRVEQRIGRIDRLGQLAERISIVSLSVSNTVEDRILLRLYERINVFRESIGDLEEILGETTEKLIADFLDPALTDEERDLRAKASELAVYNTQMEQRKLEDEAINMAWFSDYALDRVEQDRKRGRWLGPTEILALVEDFFGRNYPGTRIKHIGPDDYTFAIALSPEGRRDLAYFIDERHPGTPTRLHRGHRTVTCIFDARSIRGRRGEAEFIEPSHPLIQWIRAKYDVDSSQIHRVSAVGLDAAIARVSPGDYAYCVHRWSFAGLKSEHFLVFGAMHVETGSLLAGTTAEQLVNLAARQGGAFPNAVNLIPSLARVCNGVRLCEEQLGVAFGKRLEGVKAENESWCAHREASARSFARRRIGELKSRLLRLRQAGRLREIPMTETLVRREQKQLGLKLDRIARHKDVDATMAPFAYGVIRVE